MSYNVEAEEMKPDMNLNDVLKVEIDNFFGLNLSIRWLKWIAQCKGDRKLTPSVFILFPYKS